MSDTSTSITVAVSILNLPIVKNDREPLQLRIPVNREAQVKKDVANVISKELSALREIKESRRLSTADLTDWVNLVSIHDLLTSPERWDGFYLSTENFFFAFEMMNEMLEESILAWEESGRTSSRYGARAYHAVVFMLISKYHI